MTTSNGTTLPSGDNASFAEPAKGKGKAVAAEDDVPQDAAMDEDDDDDDEEEVEDVCSAVSLLSMCA